MAEDTGTKAIAKKAQTTMTKIGIAAVCVVVGLVIGIAATLMFQAYNPPDAPDAPTELASTVVFDRIMSQDELVCVSQDYVFVEKVGRANKIPFTDIDIPLTDNSFWYRYAGRIKMGVNLATAAFRQDGSTISVELDLPYLISNTPDMKKTGVLEERNNILNPIHVEDVDALQAACIEKSIKEANAGGIRSEARTNAEENLTKLLNAALGDEYAIEFEWRSGNDAQASDDESAELAAEDAEDAQGA